MNRYTNISVHKNKEGNLAERGRVAGSKFQNSSPAVSGVGVTSPPNSVKPPKSGGRTLTGVTASSKP